MLDLYPPEKRGKVMAIWGMGVMVGPILGPTLGGYLTDAYNWRWVFYVNVPFGIAAVTGSGLFLRDTHRDASAEIRLVRLRRCWASALARCSCMLDRGTTKDWFSSSEIVIEAVIAGLGLLSLPCPHADREEILHAARNLQGPQFRLRAGPDVRHRPHHARELGAAAALSARTWAATRSPKRGC